MTKELLMSSLEELPETARELLKYCQNKKIFAFLGEMGAGKTTIIGALCHELGVREKVVSPSFAIVNEYSSAGKVFHIDLYRLKDINEVIDIGIEEYLTGKNYCFIEWPQLIEQLLPPSTVYITIDVIESNKRRLKILNP